MWSLPKESWFWKKSNQFTDDYELLETLGEGAFGKVGKCKNLTNGQICAVKMISKANMSKRELKELAKEIDIVKDLDHPNIMKMYESYEDKSFLYIVTELIEGGELFDELIRRKKLSEEDAASVIKQVLEVLSYCHANNIVHKDLKPENVLLEKKKEITSIKIIDFGTAQKFNPEKKMTEVIGTPYYVAPEVLEGSYDEKWDIWGAGVIMFILLSGIPPFNGKDDEAILRAVKRGKFEFRQDKWKSVSTEAKDLISKMLVLEPEDRISATKALDHEWIKKYDNGEIDDTKLNKALSGLKKHKSDQKMQQAALSYMVMHMVTKEDTKELDEAFKMLDTNHDGKLSLEELLEGVKEVFPEMTKEEATKMFKKADTSF